MPSLCNWWSVGILTCHYDCTGMIAQNVTECPLSPKSNNHNRCLLTWKDTWHKIFMDLESSALRWTRKGGKFYVYLLFFLWLHHVAWGILVPRAETEPGPSTVKVLSFNRGTGEFPSTFCLLRESTHTSYLIWTSNASTSLKLRPVVIVLKSLRESFPQNYVTCKRIRCTGIYKKGEGEGELERRGLL